MSRTLRLSGLACLVGAAAALGHAPYGVWPATLAALACVFVLFERCTTARQMTLCGWGFGTGYFAVALSWIVEPFLVTPEVHGWMAPFALLFLSTGLALFWALAFRLAAAFGPQRMAGLVLTLSLVELARAYVLTGFPWAGLAQIWVGVGPDQYLAAIGPHGLGALTLICGMAIARAVAGRGTIAWRLAGPVFVGLFVGTGVWLKSDLPAPDLRPQIVRLVQPNASQHQKWDPDMIPVFLDRALDATGAGAPPDLVVWPETSVPALMEFATPIFEDMTTAARGAQVIAGINRRQDLRLYNAAVLLDGDPVPTQIYDKHRLVPFGEYVPLGDLAAGLGLTGFAARMGQGFSAGPGPRVMDLGALGTALPLICYEGIFPHLLRSDTRADMLIQITNDAWFGAFSGPYQHLAQARMRAIEQGLPMIRAANTGISAMIDPAGRILAQIPLGQTGFVDAALPAPRPKTFYARTGDWLALGVFLLVLAAALIHRRLKTNGNSD